jgi:CheY-like chemotaxis protein
MSKSNTAGREQNQKLILLVEDEALIAMAETATLERHGYAVRTVANGEAAVSEGAREDVGLILMDIDLGAGAMDGTQAAQRILEQREVPIVFLTSHNEREMVERVRGITRYGYVLKNSGEFVLIQSIETAFELFEAR